ncbi:MAG: 2-amino-4-ketopentanoate thiolase beta subunit [Clostridiales bacterium]|jgi:cysteine synthase|nr:2-amino-4-ketopentanoate thiolase beta subunit [Clostridiales bacterium]MDN5282121.1 2-amino-4-ketopentanoate thiolase beta subunit [Candidatus Ozemobacter sp.]
MNMDTSYQAVMARKNEIMKSSMGIDYDIYRQGEIAFDYERMMNDCGFSLEDIIRIQAETKVGNTPLFELRNLTEAVRKISAPGKGARIFLKDEAANASGSFKARRASISAYVAAQKGYKGVIAATSGNYGAAVASQAAQRNLKCIIVQEVFDSKGIGQPEIVEKGRKCEAFGAEVIKLSVGPELFYYLLLTLEETGFFNASLYTPFGIKGVESLGNEIALQVRAMTGKDPDAVVVTHAGGGNLTGTARGLIGAGCNAKIVACSVDLSGLHMASDNDFNRKSFTTGHTGFGVPFATWPDRVDVPRNAARSLRYMDDYVLVKQGEVFYITELLAKMEGIERGPAGNTSVTGAVALAREMDQDQIIVVQETEYTGAGKHHNSQLAFARNMGIEVRRGNPEEGVNGKSIVIPENLSQVKGMQQNMEKLRQSYLRNAAKHCPPERWSDTDRHFIAADVKKDLQWLERQIETLS